MSEKLLCSEALPPPCGMVVFGASGDLTMRKIVPSLFHLFQRGLLSDQFFLLGVARSDLTDDAFRSRIDDKLGRTLTTDQRSQLTEFLQRCFYVSGNYTNSDAYQKIARVLQELEQTYHTGHNRIFYLSTPPQVYHAIAHSLSMQGLTREPPDEAGWKRIIFEKPFCWDLSSALDLDRALKKNLSEHQIYRIDHYLGKDTVQNILLFRFSNAIFEPIWSRQHIDHVQIMAAEELGVEHRAGYYEQSGLLRDMFQNHMLQVMALAAMEVPATFDADRIRDEKVKLLRSVRPFSEEDIARNIVRAQYAEGALHGTPVPAYRAEERVAPDSETETFVAAQFFIDNWRWKGVPFYLRSGKRLARKLTEIAIAFKPVPHSIFASLAPGDLATNTLVFTIQPHESISLRIQAKQPGSKLCMHPFQMIFQYKEAFGVEFPEAYERLLLDCMAGDPTLFIRSDGMEIAWSLITPVLDAWKAHPEASPLRFYHAGSWGPDAADEFLRRDGRQWRNVCNTQE